MDEDLDRPALPTPVRAPDDTGPAPDELLVPHEARALIRASSGRAPTGIRNRALVAVMYRSGLRPGEALALKPPTSTSRPAPSACPPARAAAAALTGLDARTRELIARLAGAPGRAAASRRPRRSSARWPASR